MTSEVERLRRQRDRLISHMRVLVSSPVMHRHNVIYLRDVLAEASQWQEADRVVDDGPPPQTVHLLMMRWHDGMGGTRGEEVTAVFADEGDATAQGELFMQRTGMGRPLGFRVMPLVLRPEGTEPHD